MLASLPNSNPYSAAAAAAAMHSFAYRGSIQAHYNHHHQAYANQTNSNEHMYNSFPFFSPQSFAEQILAAHNSKIMMAAAVASKSSLNGTTKSNEFNEAAASSPNSSSSSSHSSPPCQQSPNDGIIGDLNKQTV